MPDYIVNASNTVTTTTTSTNQLNAVVSGRANLDVVVPNAPTLAVTIGPNPLVPVIYVGGPQGPQGPHGPPGSGITSINGLSGIVNIYGAGNIAVSTSGQSIYVSGINLANSGDISALSNRLGQTGSYLYNLLTGISGSSVSGVSGVLQSQITSLSGYTNSLVAATGQAAWTHGQDNAINLSGIIQQTGNSLYQLITGNSGQALSDYASKSQLTQTGVALAQRDLDISGVLQSQINANPSGYITTGQTGQFYPASNPQAYATSGDLTQTGQVILTLLSGASGTLQEQIGALPTSGNLQSTGQQLYGIITGLSGQAQLDYATKIQLTQTGISLGAEIDAVSGYVGLVSGELDNQITASGNAAVDHANGIGINLSGDLTQTGSYLYGQTTGLSGYVISLISAASAGVSAINGASGILSIVGTGAISVITEGQMIWISGDLDAGAYATTAYVTGVSGALTTRIALTGSQAISYANNIGNNLSGNLTQTGVVLGNKIDSLSGYVNSQDYETGLAAILYASGVSGDLQAQIDALPTSSQLYNTGSYLYNLVTGFSGQSAIDYATKTELAQTGGASIAYTDSVATILSGNLTATGQTLYALITGATGSASTIYATKAQLTQTGVDLIARDLAISGALDTKITATGQQAWSAAQNNALNLSGNLTQTGATLGSKIDTLSGYVNNQDYLSGRAAVLYTSGASGALQSQISSLVTSGNLQATGQQLYTIITGLSGQSVIDYATKTQLTQTGSVLNSKINSLSGFVGLVSGGLEARITASGNAAINHANGIGVNLSGNLTQTGSRLFNLVTGLSGVVDGTFVHRTGNETISGAKQFLNGLGISGINFNGASGSGIFIQVQTDGGVSFYGTGAGGSLLSIQDNSTGSIFAVTNLYEAPILEVFDDGRVVAGAFNSNALFVSGQGVSFGVNYVPTGKAVFISGDTQYLGNIFSGDRNIWDIYYPRTNPSGFITGLAGTGSLATLAQLNALSGYVNSQDAATGSAAVNHANSIGATISGNLTQTGITLLSRDVLISGLLSTGIAQTGSTLDGKINAVSGFVSQVSGGLEIRIAQTGRSAFLATSGASGVLQVQINALPTSTQLYQTGSNLYNLITGASGQYNTDFATKTQLTQTGQTLDAKINSVSGWVGLVSGGLEARIVATGNSAVAHANGIGVSLSGNLALTGQALINRDLFLSGLLATGIAQTGSILDNKINSLSGFVGLVSGGLENRIIQSGNAAINHANGIGSILSGNLTATGANLQGQINSLNTNLVNVVYTSGTQFISGTKYFYGNTYLDNLFVTGTQTVINTQDLYVGDNWMVLNATGGARDSAIFISTGITGASATGAVLGLDVPSNTWRFGFGSQQTDLINLPRIASGEAVDIVASNLTLTGVTLFNRDLSISGGLEARIAQSGQAAILYASGASGYLQDQINAIPTSGQLALTGSNLYILITGLSGSFDTKVAATGSTLDNKINSLSGFVGQVSGGLETRIAQSGSAAVNHANSIGQVISGNLTVTGQTLYNIVTGLSGQTNLDYATKVQLTTTGQTLDNKINSVSGWVGLVSGGLEARITATGNSAVTHANGIGLILSGNLTQTGQTLVNQINSLSGFTTGVSGYLQGQINAIPTSGQLALTGSNLYNLVTGLSGSFNIQIASTGSQAWNAANNNGVNLSGNLTQTGISLINRGNLISGWLSTGIAQTGSILDGKINALSGFVGQVSGGLETRIAQTGVAAVVHANGIGSILSGNLTTTGQVLYQLITGSSGQANINYATVANLALTGSNLYILTTGLSGSFNTQIIQTGASVINHVNGMGSILSGNLTATGATLFARDAAISGGLEARIAQTGQAAWISANGAASTLSGNLTTTGQTLQARITGLSGVMESMFVHRSGNEIISGRKQFLNGLGTSGINFNGASGSGIFLQVETQGGLSYYGTGASGSLLSIEDNSSGSIFAVTDNYEAPILEVFDDGRIVGGSFNSNALFVSGAGVAFGVNNVPTGFAVFISGNTQYIGHIYSGTTNISDIFYPRNNPSGYITSGDLIASGNASIAHANSIGQTISGNLTLTGQTLQGRINSLSGFIGNVSGGLEVRIFQSGAAAISYATTYANSVGTNLSGNLTTTGATLYRLITGASGVMNATFANTVFTTGQQVISGIKFFNSGDYQSQKTISANYSVSPNDSRLYCNNSTPITLTFGSAVTNSGQLIKIKLINTGVVSFTGTFGQFFDGAASYVAAGQYNAYEIHANGANWYLW